MSSQEDLENQNSFIVSIDTFNGFKESLYNLFGDSANTMLYSAGVEAGRHAFKRRFEATKNRKDVLSLFVEDKFRHNWGEVTFQYLDSEAISGKVLVRKCFEAKNTESKAPNCFFLTGYFAGFLTEFMQHPVSLNEVLCVAKGDDHCELIISADQSHTHIL
jgi:predicted hydrocarbon binding protein